MNINETGSYNSVSSIDNFAAISPGQTANFFYCIVDNTYVLESLGDKKAMILKNHGLLTVGRTVPDAFIRLHALERSCQIQVDAGAAGTLNTLSDNVASKSGADRDEFLNSNKVEAGQLEFAALMRKIDRIDPSYRD